MCRLDITGQHTIGRYKNQRGMPNHKVWFQQDGALSYFKDNVRMYLDNTFPDWWIGRQGIECHLN